MLLEGNRSDITLTGEVEVPVAEKNLDTYAGEINGTVKSVPEATLNSADHKTLSTVVEYGSDGNLNGQSTCLQLRESNADMNDGESKGKESNCNEFMEELENMKVDSGRTETENKTAVHEAFTNTKIDENFSTKGEISSELNNCFNYSICLLSKYNALHDISPQRLMNEPELAPTYSKENGDCSFEHDIPFEHKGPMSSFKRSSQYSLGDRPVLKRGRRRKFSKVISSRRILRNSSKVKEAFVDSFEAYKHDGLGDQLSNEGQFSDGIRYLYGKKHQGKYLVNACKYSTLSNNDSFSDSKLSYKQESSFPKTGMEQKIFTTAESTCKSERSKYAQGPEGSNQTTDALTPETDSIGIVELNKICSQSDFSALATQSSTMCKEAANENEGKLLNVTNSNRRANNSIESQTEVYTIKCNDNIMPQSSSSNFKLKRLHEKTSNNKRIFDAFKFSDAAKNPIVLLNEVTNLNEAKTHCNINGLHESPRKYKKSNDIPSPAFPHSVIDDLIACPQRLTRGRTQLMMMGHNEETSSCKRPRKRRKTEGESGEEGDLLIALSEQGPLVEKFQLQRLTRRRVRSLGCMKSNLPNLQYIKNFDKEQCRDPPKIDSSRLNPGSSKSEQKESIDQACNTNNAPEFTVSPTRLTRARVRLLGLGKHNDDLVLV